MTEIEQALQDVKRAVGAMDFEKANAHWRRYVGLLEADMGRAGSVERLTPDVRRDQESR